MKMSGYARAFGLDEDPTAEAVHIRCGYKRAPRSAAALALAEWTRTDNYDASAWLPWPEMRAKASLWNHKTVKTALLGTEGGGASLLGFQDQSCLVLLHHPEEATMRPVPWVFALRPSPQDPSVAKIQVRRPSGTKFGEAVFSLQKPDKDWRAIDEASLSRGLRNAVAAAERLRADTARIAQSALKGAAPPRPCRSTPWEKSAPMLDFLPFVGWTAKQGHRVEAIARDLADWLAPALDASKFRSLSITLRAPMPEDAGTEPIVDLHQTTVRGTIVRTREAQAISRLSDILSPEIAANLVNEIGPLKGLDFRSGGTGHKPHGPRLAMAHGATTPSNHRRLALYHRFGAPRLPEAAE